jgi:predicted AlkP superfamily pyrophosphatase or phosphodiesterase
MHGVDDLGYAIGSVSSRLAVRALAAVSLACYALLVACADAPAESSAPPQASAARRIAPASTVILISLDGWRWDYLDRADAPNLEALAQRGVRADALIPVFPSKTFPVHYTIVTGLYPEHHGIIGNVISDRTIGQLFTMSSATARDPRWWGGEPVWNTARRQGLRTASMFWPGSDVAIGGHHPHDWHPYSRNFPNRERVKQVLDWLARPEPARPSFVTLYFSDVDAAGHDAGPDSRDVLAAAARIDRLIGELTAGIDRLGLSDRVTLVVVSDHGMASISRDRRIFIERYLDRRQFDLQDSGPVVSIFPRRTTTAADIHRALAGSHPQMTVYLREQMPERLHYRAHPRIAPVIAVAAEGWTISARSIQTAFETEAGAHGYDPAVRSMHGLFIAAGPDVRGGVVVPAFEAVHVYELLCRLLGVTPAPNDGDPAVTAVMMKNGT